MDELQQQPTAEPTVMPKKYLFAILSVAVVLIVVAGVFMYVNKKSVSVEEFKTVTGEPLNLGVSQPDSDQDGLTDAEETQLGTDSAKQDTDADGLSDGIEVNITKTDPKNQKSKDPALTDYEWVRKQNKR